MDSEVEKQHDYEVRAPQDLDRMRTEQQWRKEHPEIFYDLHHRRSDLNTNPMTRLILIHLKHLNRKLRFLSPWIRYVPANQPTLTMSSRFPVELLQPAIVSACMPSSTLNRSSTPNTFNFLLQSFNEDRY